MRRGTSQSLSTKCFLTHYLCAVAKLAGQFGFPACFVGRVGSLGVGRLIEPKGGRYFSNCTPLPC